MKNRISQTINTMVTTACRISRMPVELIFPILNRNKPPNSIFLLFKLQICPNRDSILAEGSQLLNFNTVAKKYEEILF